MGAEVIKIEQPKVGDETRKWGPPFKGPDSTYFISINRNKKSMTVDLKQPQGKQIIYDLVGKSDIFLSNFTPQQNEKLKIDYPTLSKINQKLIYGSVQGFPLNSAWENKAAFDLTIQAMSGFMHCTGDPNGTPFKVGYAVTDILAGMHLLQGVMGAIIHRERTGEGQFINTSLLEANLYSLCYVVSSWLNGETEYKRMGNQHPNIAPYTVFKTKDEQYIVIGVATDLQFQKLSELLCMEVRREFKTNRDRCMNRDSLTHEIQSQLSQNWLKVDLMREMSTRGIPFSEINSVKELFEKPEIIAMGLNQSINSEKYEGKLSFSKNPIYSSANEHAEMKEPPLLGENTEEILRVVPSLQKDNPIVVSHESSKQKIQKVNTELNEEAAPYKQFYQMMNNSQNQIIDSQILTRIKFQQVSERKAWQGVNALFCGIPGQQKQPTDPKQSQEHHYSMTNQQYIKFRFQELLARASHHSSNTNISSAQNSSANFEYSELMIKKINQLTGSTSQFSNQQIISSQGTGSRVCLYKMLKCESKLVKFIFELNGLIGTDRHDWNVLWTHTQGKTYFYERLNQYQKINHFPNSTELTRKDRMAINLKKMQDKYSRTYFNFIPETYVLPDQFAEFEEQFMTIENRLKLSNSTIFGHHNSADNGVIQTAKAIKQNLWIVKPSCSSRGRGIYIIENPKQVTKHESLVVSRYIDSPLLLYGHKFDLRIYVVITSYDPLKIYVFREGLVRFASEKYDISKFNDTTKFSHLTNYSINKKNENYVQNENAEDDDSGFKWSLSAMNEHFEEQGIDVNLMWSKIYDVIIKSIMSIEDQIKTQLKKSGVHRNNCYELFGYDIILDNNLNPWLLEVNLSPSLAFDSPLDLKIKGNLLKDTFNIIGVRKPDYDANNKATVSQDDPKKKMNGTMYNKPMKDHHHEQVSAEQQSLVMQELSKQLKKLDEFQWTQKEYLNSYIQLPQKTKEIIIESLLEFKRRGNFIRIYPNKNSDFYDCFISQNKQAQQSLYQYLYSEAFVSFKDSMKTANLFKTQSLTMLKPLKSTIQQQKFKSPQQSAAINNKFDIKSEDDMTFKDLYLCIYEYLKRFQTYSQNVSKTEIQILNNQIMKLLNEDTLWKRVDQQLQLKCEANDQVRATIKSKLELLEKFLISFDLSNPINKKGTKDQGLQYKSQSKNRLKAAGNTITGFYQSVDSLFLKYKNFSNLQLTETLIKKINSLLTAQGQKSLAGIADLDHEESIQSSLSKDHFYYQFNNENYSLLDYLQYSVNVVNDDKASFLRKSGFNNTINNFKPNQDSNVINTTKPKVRQRTIDENWSKSKNADLLNKVKKLNQKLTKLKHNGGINSHIQLVKDNSNSSSVAFLDKRLSQDSTSQMVSSQTFINQHDYNSRERGNNEKVPLKMLEDIMEEQQNKKQKTPQTFFKHRYSKDHLYLPQNSKEFMKELGNQFSPQHVKNSNGHPFQFFNQTFTNNHSNTNQHSVNQDKSFSNRDHQIHSSQSNRMNTSKNNIYVTTALEKSSKIYEIYGPQNTLKARIKQSQKGANALALNNSLSNGMNSNISLNLVLSKKKESNMKNHSFNREHDNTQHLNDLSNPMILPGINK